MANLSGKKLVNYNLSETARNLLLKLQAKLGIDKTAIVEISIREKAEKENITLE